MNCRKCRYYTRSKVYGNGCSCVNDIRPCDLEKRIQTNKKRRDKRNKRYREE